MRSCIAGICGFSLALLVLAVFAPPAIADDEGRYADALIRSGYIASVSIEPPRVVVAAGAKIEFIPSAQARRVLCETFLNVLRAGNPSVTEAVLVRNGETLARC